MNKMYGFENECLSKYNIKIFELFQNFFITLPLGHIINNKIFIVHGGLTNSSSLLISSLQNINRFNNDLTHSPLNDLLWSDPMFNNGFAPSPRGLTCTFGPDITLKFLELNNLDLLIRSHQVQENGYNITHQGKCITIFSAPNYIGQMNNKGAIINIKFLIKEKKYELNYKTFIYTPSLPQYPPMKYSSFNLTL